MTEKANAVKRARFVSALLRPLMEQLYQETVLYSDTMRIDDYVGRNAIVWLMQQHKKDVMIELFRFILIYPHQIFSILRAFPEAKPRFEKKNYGNIPLLIVAWYKWAEKNGYGSQTSSLAKTVLEAAIKRFNIGYKLVLKYLKTNDLEKIREHASAYPAETVHALIDIMNAKPERPIVLDNHKIRQLSELLTEITGEQLNTKTQNGILVLDEMKPSQIIRFWFEWTLRATDPFSDPLRQATKIVGTP